MNNANCWYIIKIENEQCEIVELDPNQVPETKDYWGPFSSKEEAIARRVGLIRAGKCQPQF
ncbi:conserved hypothetical protein [Crocosphaera subtropica ATCC 51142]|uniref:DDE transposase family protein n=1 Tax=Crocosphaera subtropica (strain ATCC 51142 / BH68) TaxID=43989 RepID=B1WPN1_CROS5|nr:hypothetical protein [Crocosphaera subtropica]ACB51601.1 conserved hypothetical protein [Crocosphaera subtropica ATCC 51142]